VKRKQDRKQAIAERALRALEDWMHDDVPA
jgi:hypothetical protein